jgi:UDP-glucose 6-dehydrogenase
MGGRPAATQTVADVYSKAYPGVLQVQCNALTAELVKYVGNCFLATKVSFANEIYQICSKLGVDYGGVINAAMLDKRLGKSHWKVPGPDGHFGFGLTCFPKDINALIALAESLGVDPKVMKAAWAKNLEVRPEKDWEQMKGRAVL